ERIAHPREELLRSFAIPCAGTEELRDLIVDRTRGGGPTLEVNERGAVLNDLRETRSRGIAVPELLAQGVEHVLGHGRPHELQQLERAHRQAEGTQRGI